MNKDVETQIVSGCPWDKLPQKVKLACGNSQEEYHRLLLEYCIMHQVRYRGSAVRHVIKNEKVYYEKLLQFSKKNLMLYPYHLQERMIGLRMTAFSYYISMMEEIMRQERSYDTLPNFTAADCLRLLGIGRNQYIELMNQCRSNRKFSFRRKPQVREQLPATPIPIQMEPWWIVHNGYITEDDIRLCTPQMKGCIDRLIDFGPQEAGTLDREVLKKLYTRGLVYLNVPIVDDSKVSVPPLEGFVMNRVLGDYFETLLYKIFVSIDEHTSVSELATMLDISPALVQNAVSVFCRLGFARLKDADGKTPTNLHSSWKEGAPGEIQYLDMQGLSLLDLDASEELSKEADGMMGISDRTSESSSVIHESDSGSVDVWRDDNSLETMSQSSATSSAHLRSCYPGKRIAFLFDSSLTAFLMMGNLSPGLKNHAVTLFEVGKLTDEAVGSFVTELRKVPSTTDGEGEAQRYFDHAITLRTTIEFFRHNQYVTSYFCDGNSDPDTDSENSGVSGIGLDLIRCESLNGLNTKTVSRLINKNYHMVVSMAPLNDEMMIHLSPVKLDDGSMESTNAVTAHWFGPPCAEINSVWFKLFLYHMTGFGPPSLLLKRGTKFNRLPEVFMSYSELLITSMGHDPCIVSTSNIILMLAETLSHSPVLIQGYKLLGSDSCTQHLAFPFSDDDIKVSPVSEDGDKIADPSNDEIKRLLDKIDSELAIKDSFGYITLFRPSNTVTRTSLSFNQDIPVSKWQLLDLHFGIPLFDCNLNREVCQKISNNDMCNEEKLANLHAFNTSLIGRVKSFIRTHQENPDTKYDAIRVDENVPWPCENLMFCDGELTAWRN